MTRYRNINGDSGVEAYEIGADYIAVKFYSTQRLYVYSYRRAGKYHVEQMKRLAQIGDGLNGYINKNVRKLYD